MALEHHLCQRAPEGWQCTREPGHPGPCPAILAPLRQRPGIDVGALRWVIVGYGLALVLGIWYFATR